MEKILVAVSKNALSPEELKGIQSLNGRSYGECKEFMAEVDKIFATPGAKVDITFGGIEDWADFLGKSAFDNQAYIYIVIQLEQPLSVSC